jgi:hypothetical protein
VAATKHGSRLHDLTIVDLSNPPSRTTVGTPHPLKIQLGKRLTFATEHVSGPFTDPVTFPVAAGPDKITDCPTARELRGSGPSTRD